MRYFIATPSLRIHRALICLDKILKVEADIGIGYSIEFETIVHKTNYTVDTYLQRRDVDPLDGYS